MRWKIDGRRLLGRAATLVVLIALMIVLRSVMDRVPTGSPAADATVALGFLLLSAYVAGQFFKELGLPRITGYILLGLLIGPDALGLLSSAHIADLRLIDQIAISLIALSAGGELKLADLRSRGRSMGGIMVTEMVAVFAVVAGGVLIFSDALPFAVGLTALQVGVLAMMFGSIAIANSPSVAIAVITDTRARGPVTSTVLGVTVMKDVVVIVLFAIALSSARSLLQGTGSFDTSFAVELSWEIGGSIIMGAVSGTLISLYLSVGSRHLVLFALAVAFLNAYIARALHLEVLLLSLTAGFFVENVSPVHGEPFVKAVERNSLPLYALFFALAGASVHLADLAALWPYALAFVAARAVAIFAGTYAGASWTGAEPLVRRYAWLGFVSQAGVTLGMVIIAERAFPAWGAELRTMFVAMVAIHELIGPVLLQYGLQRAGETNEGARAPPGTGASGKADLGPAGMV
ncbi:MAG: cation:proton antiporter [Longimicrobiales bacterium]